MVLKCVFSPLEQQIFIGPYSYDFGSRKLKKLVEINGTYWHADPRVYKADDLLIGQKKAYEIWAKDLEKISYAKNYGYDVLSVWELDFCKNPNLTLKLINNFLEK
jgi:very-short-patch-repair endonuclease